MLKSFTPSQHPQKAKLTAEQESSVLGVFLYVQLCVFLKKVHVHRMHRINMCLSQSLHTLHTQPPGVFWVPAMICHSRGTACSPEVRHGGCISLISLLVLHSMAPVTTVCPRR